VKKKIILGIHPEMKLLDYNSFYLLIFYLFMVLGIEIEARRLCMLDKCCTTGLCPQLGNCICNVLKNHHADFHSGCSIFHFIPTSIAQGSSLSASLPDGVREMTSPYGFFFFFFFFF
jgi:hypothetical protein